MRQFLCLAIVCLFATASVAQNNTHTARTAKSADSASATPHKTAEEKKADQAEADEKLVAALLAAMDTDKDGIVTRAEMAHAMAVLHKFKKDPKGNMTVPDKVADSTDPNAAAANDSNNPNPQGPAGAGAGAEARGNELVARFMKQYDRNGDGRITPDEVPPQMAAKLRAAGLGRSGAIEPAELQAYFQRMGEAAKAFGAMGPNRNGANGLPPQQ
jgi:Ca2+-binding EF-hand superfamily protein